MGGEGQKRKNVGREGAGLKNEKSWPKGSQMH